MRLEFSLTLCYVQAEYLPIPDLRSPLGDGNPEFISGFLISLLLLCYTFLLSPSSPLYRDEGRGWMKAPPTGSAGAGYNPSGWGGEGLKNRVFFVFIFVEMISWLWCWVTVKEEAREILIKRAKRRGSYGYGQ